MNRSHSIFRYQPVLMLSLFLLASCGGGGSDDDDDDNRLSGRFIDSAVEGIWFETASFSGFTDADGTFFYLAGETISFFIGDIEIGSANGSPQITPIELVPGAVDASNQVVENLLRFIQSLDDDGDPDNGILISGAVFNAADGQAIDFTLDTAMFEAAADALLNTLTAGNVTALVDAADAIAHFNDSVNFGTGSGTVTLSGADTAVVGTSFSPDTFAEASVSTSTVVNIQQGANVLSLNLNNGNLANMSFTYASINDPFNVYSYAVNCFTGSCAATSVDANANTVAFSNQVFPVSGITVIGQLTNVATAPISFDGEIEWQE